MNEFWNGLDSKGKAITALLVMVIVIIAYKYFTAKAAAFNSSIAQKAELKVLEESGITKTHHTSFYSQSANKLETAMRGGGTDENSVYKVFQQIMNDADVIELEKAFGLRDEVDLSGWLYGDLEDYEIDIVNNHLRLNGATKQY